MGSFTLDPNDPNLNATQRAFVEHVMKKRAEQAALTDTLKKMGPEAEGLLAKLAKHPGKLAAGVGAAGILGYGAKSLYDKYNESDPLDDLGLEKDHSEEEYYQARKKRGY